MENDKPVGMLIEFSGLPEVIVGQQKVRGVLARMDQPAVPETPPRFPEVHVHDSDSDPLLGCIERWAAQLTPAHAPQEVTLAQHTVEQIFEATGVDLTGATVTDIQMQDDNTINVTLRN